MGYMLAEDYNFHTPNVWKRTILMHTKMFLLDEYVCGTLDLYHTVDCANCSIRGKDDQTNLDMS